MCPFAGSVPVSRYEPSGHEWVLGLWKLRLPENLNPPLTNPAGGRGTMSPRGLFNPMPFRTTAARLGAIIALTLPMAAWAGQPPTGAAAKADADAMRLVTGKTLTPSGGQTNVGSFPTHLILSPDGKYALVTTAGSRERLTVLRVGDGMTVSRIDFDAPSKVLKGKKQALYFGLVCGNPVAGQTPVYAARGGEGLVSVLSLSEAGILTDTLQTVSISNGMTGDAPFVAGLALSADGRVLYAADNSVDPQDGLRGSLRIVDLVGGTPAKQVSLPGYPYAVATFTAGTAGIGKVYVTSEQRGVVSVIETAGQTRDIATGAQPIALLLDKKQERLFVANAGSDTISVVDTKTDRVRQTILVRPDNARGLAGATPTSFALSPDESRLYVTVADMNAVAVVDLPAGQLAGYVPVGWYPTGVVVSPDGKRLLVANAKGVAARNPNAKPVSGVGDPARYIENIIEGTVTTLDVPGLPDLKRATARVFANNSGRTAAQPFVNPGIKHVFYIIKENRTYDQVLGDLPEGNGDPSLVLFGRDVTPNLHTLAERFVLLDNFYCCAEVSGDGWNWSTGGMASEFTARNVPHNYGGRARAYDFEGSNNGVSVDLRGIPDAARPAGGYLWDLCDAHGKSFRNYGFFTDDLDLPRNAPEANASGKVSSPTKRVLMGKTDGSFASFDTTYPDSDARRALVVPAAPKEKTVYGAFNDPSRFAAWKREFDAYVKNGNLPQLSMVRFMRDHTAGTTPGLSSPRAMVADNDYAVGQMVQAISHSPYWKSSAIVIVEDDAQSGYDHVDAHRSTAYVVSPFVRSRCRDSRFYNTDSALRTIELLLGMPPMTEYDAIAPPFDIFAAHPENAGPYVAVLPAAAIVGEVNGRTAYRAADSARLIPTRREESAPDEALNDILWHAIKGAIPAPRRHYSLSAPAARDAD